MENANVQVVAGAQAMIDLGAQWAKSFKGGEVIALVGGLGMGKTHLSKGMARGLGHEGEVTSPTFTLLHEYVGGRLPMFHLDLYRMESADELLRIGWDEYLDEGGVVVVEWADRFADLMPPETNWVEITPDGDAARQVSAPFAV
ncbi:tRNA (adenosine(37)-N6)-threonylcarbamoyltransferase complex ATPase subunit type 1 TsaE [Persicirhabdus sediminis]|uniref:tRNA threonylcarbamoyladenosine biosynthesis protein TsaE n=1 Tax=Persicirhabdus sediminis TaxID=454144 RepID=A0A8J7MCS8_9BACT|nr:tRNA (adenosine(37)-N6)-threonylcarbamoyltransferase complex ATPase subunit type 1 TsaE [Persicirhabdus sediminis]MBK1790716.1 tRNA (adenosine(37)-N6)-threonylcarbamoyltransferase complex ATPase subunit type 1 TsaE [Persicirhabdus sediminis]